MFTDLNFFSINLKVKKNDLERFIQKVYNKFYKKYRLFHVTSSEKNYVHLKLTDDIATFVFMFLDQNEQEYVFYLDGVYDHKSDTIYFDNIEFEKSFTILTELSNVEFHVIIKHFKEFSTICDGDILFLVNKEPHRLKNGKKEDAQVLLNHMYEGLHETKKDELQELFHLFKDSF